LDPAITRPGRLDAHLYVGPPDVQVSVLVTMILSACLWVLQQLTTIL